MRILNGGDREILARMTRILAHRGPDDEGMVFWEKERVGLGHRRLSILDLSEAGHQPMGDQEGRYWIVFNGEIYNFKDIRKNLEARGYRFRSSSDTEVLLYAYREWGKACLERLNGMFAFAIWDRKERKLFAARDRLGIKPFYYAQIGETFVFASEIKAILASGEIRAEVDWGALHSPWGHQVSPQTGFQGIQKLPPGCCLTVSDGRLSIRRYWDIEIREEERDHREVVEELQALLEDAVRLQMIADVPVGAFLSGGLDSSTIVALMSRHTNHPVRTFTIRFTEEDQKFEAMPDDSRYAQQVAKQFGCTHQEITIEPDVVELLPKLIWHLDEPLSDPASINTYLISKAAREAGVVVLLNGIGGDEVFGGYRKQLACLLAERYQQVFPGIVRSGLEAAMHFMPVAGRNRGLRTFRWAKRFLSFASMPSTERFLSSDLSLSREEYEQLFLDTDHWPYRDLPIVDAHRAFLDSPDLSYLTRMCLCDTQIFLSEHNLTYSDKATMAAGVEGRPPLIDHRIVEFMFSLAPKFRIKGKTQKYLLKKSMESVLPREIIYRPKAPFGSPLRSWIRGPLSTMVGDFLSEDSLKARGLYNPFYVSSLIEKTEKDWKIMRILYGRC